MEITDIIKESFVFPANDLAKLAVYIVFIIVMSILALGGITLMALGMMSGGSVISTVLGIIFFICSLILAFIITGYQISIIKSGIDNSEKAPDFVWKENLIKGIKNLVVNIV